MGRMADQVGERQAERFQVIYEANARRVLAFALRRVEQPQDAADVVADTFLVTWRRITEVPDGEQARLWLFGVARRVLANQRRATARRGRLNGRLTQLQEALTTSLPDLHTEQVLRAALQRLDEDERELLILTNWDELAPSEIAVVLAVPAGTVRSRLHRARQRLREELERQGPDGILDRGGDR